MQGIVRHAARAALAVLTLAGAACASSKSRDQQRADTPRTLAYDRGPEGRQARLFAGITLTSAQRASVDSIRAAYRERMGPGPGDRRRGDDGAPPGDRGDFAQRRQLMEEQRTAIRNVLTPEQQRIFDANVEKMRQERRSDRRGGSPPDDRRD